MGTATDESRRRGAKRDGALPTNSPCFLTACFVGIRASRECLRWQGGLGGCSQCAIGYLDRPDRAIDSGELFERCDPFVAEELRPGSVGCIG